ncbi:MAG TPA: hypothetical protein VM285_05295 [Polyangia bacterium]|nr:hypothetical protein [Polyangia bacterium]
MNHSTRLLLASCAAALLWASAMPSPLLARDAAAGRRVQVLLVAGPGDPGGAAREQRLVTELRLQLDSFEVVVTLAVDRDFGALLPAAQVAEVAGAAERMGADATVWISTADGRTLEICFVHRGGDGILTRSADIDAAPSPEATLATAVWELLQTDHPPVGVVGDAGSSLAAQLRDGEPPAPAAPPPEPAPEAETSDTSLAWGIAAGFETGGGVDTKTPTTLLGGQVAISLETAGAFVIRAGVAGLTEAEAGRAGRMRIAARVEPRLELGPAWDLGSARIAPFLRIAVPCSRFRMVLENRDDFERWYWNGRFDLGLSLSFRIGNSLGLFVAGGGGIDLIEEKFELLSGEDIENGSLFEWGMSLGAMLSL